MVVRSSKAAGLEPISLTAEVKNVEVTMDASSDVTFLQDGTITTVHSIWTTTEQMRKTAEALTEHARWDLVRAARLMALADLRDANTQENESRARQQRRERAAATRERNRDPFGFERMGL